MSYAETGLNNFGGKYSMEEVNRIMEMGSRPDNAVKPDTAYYKKNGIENGPSWAEKREFVHWLIYESNISPASKKYLKECDNWVPKY